MNRKPDRVDTVADVAEHYRFVYERWMAPGYVHHRLMLAAETMLTRLYRWERDTYDPERQTAGLVRALNSGRFAICGFVGGIARLDPVITVVEQHLGHDVEEWDRDPTHSEDDALRVLMELMQATAPGGVILWQRDPEREQHDRVWGELIERALAYAEMPR